MGRPRKNEPRSIPIPTRYSVTERDAITQAAQAAGVTTSDFIRAAALSQPLPPSKPRRASRQTVADGDKLALLLSSVGRIGNNVNQLARTANQGDWPEADGLAEAVNDIRWMRTTLMRCLGIHEAPAPERTGP